MNAIKIELAQNRDAFEPGAELAGTVSWTVAPAPQFLELRLFWFTRGKGTEDAAVVETIRFDRQVAEETRPFRFRLPEAPYSFSGKLISLRWALELIAKPSKDLARVEFVMGPGAREVRLESLPGSPGTGVQFSVSSS